MHPAPSIIFFTVASGAGYGLLFWWPLAGLLGLLPPTVWSPLTGLGLALLMSTAGLLSSTLHLGHPERAWRAISQWRSSWLSREGLSALLTYPPAALLAAFWAYTGHATAWLALPTMLGAVVTVLCTGQIYASLKPIARWHHPLTTPVYLMLAAASGAVLATLLARLVGGGPPHLLDLTALVLVVAAWLLKETWWQKPGGPARNETPESATGLGRWGAVRLLEPPHTASNYLQDEMGYRVARKHARKLRSLARILACALPVLALILAALAGGAMLGTLLALIATTSLAAGLLIERWLFFAEARHTVMLYYGSPSQG